MKTLSALLGMGMLACTGCQRQVIEKAYISENTYAGKTAQGWDVEIRESKAELELKNNVGKTEKWANYRITVPENNVILYVRDEKDDGHIPAFAFIALPLNEKVKVTGRDLLTRSHILRLTRAQIKNPMYLKNSREATMSEASYNEYGGKTSFLKHLE